MNQRSKAMMGNRKITAGKYPKDTSDETKMNKQITVIKRTNSND